MSLLQEMKLTRHLLGREKSDLLEQYCEETGADLGKTLYSLQGWSDFEVWLDKRATITIDCIEEAESKYLPRVWVRYKKSNDDRGWRSVETLKKSFFEKIEKGEYELTENAKKQYEAMK